MLAGETVRAMVPMIAPCACRYNGFAADLTDEGFIAWMGFIVILLK
jgi:hypothetical protein